MPRSWLILFALLELGSVPAAHAQNRIDVPSAVPDHTNRSEIGQAPGQALTLENAVALALGYEPAVADAEVAREQARLAALRAQLDRVSLRLDTQINELHARIASTSNTRAFTRATASLNVPLFAGFRIDANVKRTQALELSARDSLKGERRATALGVARVFWAIQRLSASQAAIDGALERLGLAHSVAKARERSGLTAPIDANRVLARQAQQQAEHASLAGQLQGALAELGVLLGVRGPLSLVPAPFGISEALETADAWVDRAHAHRPEIAAGRRQVEAARQTVRIAQADFYPQLSAYGSFEYSNNQQLLGNFVTPLPASTNPFENLNSFTQAGVLLSWNLFDTFKTYTASKDASYAEQRAALQLRDLEQEVEREVRVAHARNHQLWTQLEVLRRAETLARDNVGILRKRYENGDALVLELLESELELLQTERQRFETETNIQLAELELQAAGGVTLGTEKDG